MCTTTPCFHCTPPWWISTRRDLRKPKSRKGLANRCSREYLGTPRGNNHLFHRFSADLLLFQFVMFNNAVVKSLLDISYVVCCKERTGVCASSSRGNRMTHRRFWEGDFGVEQQGGNAHLTSYFWGTCFFSAEMSHKQGPNSQIQHKCIFGRTPFQYYAKVALKERCTSCAQIPTRATRFPLRASPCKRKHLVTSA